MSTRIPRRSRPSLEQARRTAETAQKSGEQARPNAQATPPDAKVRPAQAAAVIVRFPMQAGRRLQSVPPWFQSATCGACPGARGRNGATARRTLARPRPFGTRLDPTPSTGPDWTALAGNRGPPHHPTATARKRINGRHPDPTFSRRIPGQRARYGRNREQRRKTQAAAGPFSRSCRNKNPLKKAPA